MELFAQRSILLVCVIAFASLGTSSAKPFNETLKPAAWKSYKLENGRTLFESPHGRQFDIRGVFDLIQTLPQAITNLPQLLQPIGIQLLPDSIKLDGSWLFDQMLAMTRELLPLPETVYFPGGNQPLRMGSFDIRIGSVIFYDGHMKGHGNLKRNGPTGIELSANSRSSVVSGLIWEALEFLYEIDVEIFGLIRQPRRLLARVDALGFNSKFSVNPNDFVNFFDPILEFTALIDIGKLALTHDAEPGTAVTSDLLNRVDTVVDAYMQNIMEKTIYPRMELNLKLSLKDATKWLSVLGLRRSAVLTL